MGETRFTRASTSSSSSSFENLCNSPNTHTDRSTHTRAHTYTNGHARKQVYLDGKEPKRRKAKAGNEKPDAVLVCVDGSPWYKYHTVQYIIIHTLKKKHSENPLFHPDLQVLAHIDLNMSDLLQNDPDKISSCAGLTSAACSAQTTKSLSRPRKLEILQPPTQRTQDRRSDRIKLNKTQTLHENRI